MANEETVSLRLRLLDAKQFVAGNKEAAQSITKLGSETKSAASKAHSAEAGFRGAARGTRDLEHNSLHAHSAVHKLVGVLAGLGVGYEAIHGLSESIKRTRELRESAINLNHVQGLSAQSAGAWSAVAQVQHLSARQLGQTFGFLARNIGQATDQATAYDAKGGAIRASFNRRIGVLPDTAAGRVKQQFLLQQEQSKLQATVTKGAGKQAEAFKRLGITQQDLVKSGKDMSPLVLKVAESLGKMHGGSEKTRIATQLLGRSWQTLAPLFREGELGLAGNLRDAQRYVGPFLKGGVDSFEKIEAAQQRAEYATLGLQVGLATYLVPAITKVTTSWSQMVLDIERGNGTWGTVRDIVTGVTGTLKTVVGWFQKSELASKGLVIGLTVLGGAFAIEKVLSWGRAIRASIIVTKGLAAAEWAYNASLGATAAEIPAVIAEQEALKTSMAGPPAGAAAGGFRLWGRAMGVAAAGGIAVGIGAMLPGVTAAALRKLANLIHPGSVQKDLSIHRLLGAAPGSRGDADQRTRDYWASNPPLHPKATGRGPHGHNTPAQAFDQFVKGASVHLLRTWLHNNPKGGKTLHDALNRAHRHIPGLARGGNIMAGGMVEVGENGRELLNLPKGAQVSPLTGKPRQSATGTASTQPDVIWKTPIIIQVGKTKLAETILEQINVMQARGR